MSKDAKKVYTKDDHRLAYETWRKTRNISEAARTVKCAGQTIYRWKDPSYPCPFGCPFHDWDKLEADQNAAKKAHFEALEQGVADPVSQEIMMIEAIARGDSNHNVAAMDIVHNDHEEAMQWRLLFNKQFYHLTGVALDYPCLSAKQNGEELSMRDLYEKVGAKPKGFESGVKTLRMISERIDQLTGADIYRDAKYKKEIHGTTKDANVIDVESQDIDVKRLLKLKKMAEDNPAEFQKALESLMGSNESATSTSGSTTGGQDVRSIPESTDPPEISGD